METTQISAALVARTCVGQPSDRENTPEASRAVLSLSRWLQDQLPRSWLCPNQILH